MLKKRTPSGKKDSGKIRSPMNKSPMVKRKSAKSSSKKKSDTKQWLWDCKIRIYAIYKFLKFEIKTISNFNKNEI